MPCGLCELTFRSKPCEHKTGVLTDKEALIVNFSSLRFRNSYVNYIIAYHKTLHSKCPCINCLVKMMCYKDTATEIEECEAYSIVMDEIRPLFIVCYNQTLNDKWGRIDDKKEL